LQREVEEFSLHAFYALNLRDYARFDLRLSNGGTAYFLEANTTPSLEPMEALATSAAWAGLNYTSLVERLLWNAHHRFESPEQRGKEFIHVQIPGEMLELEVASGVLSPSPSTVDLANLLDVRPGENVLELGCGSGLLSITAAKLGARRVVATDLSPYALQATRDNAVRTHVDHLIELRAGSWYEALSDPSLPAGECEHFDVIIATPPQTPGRHPFGPKYGGPDGVNHLQAIISGAGDILAPEGRLWILAISLANTGELWSALRRHFDEVVLVHQTKRPFSSSEYEGLEPGLFEYLRSLRESGISDFVEENNGQCYFNNLFIRASKPRRT
jgi:methylase of polypeptide subunit release factors